MISYNYNNTLYLIHVFKTMSQNVYIVMATYHNEDIFKDINKRCNMNARI